MKRQRSGSVNSKAAKKPRLVRQDATVTAVVRKELRKKTDWKFTDYGISSSPIYNIGAIETLYQNLSRGTNGKDNYTGNVIRPQAITLKYWAECGSTKWTNLRVMIFQWFDSVIPSVSGILENTTTGQGVISPTLITNKQYIKVLYDKTHILSPTAADGSGNVIGYGTVDPQTVYIPGKRLRTTKFNSNSNVVQDGDIYILMISDDSALGTVNFTMYSRVTFSDE